MKIGILFDLDGTLLNTLEDLCDGVNYVMDSLGYPRRTLEETRQFVGNGAARLLALAVPQGVDSGEALSRFQAYYPAHCRIKTAPYPGIPEALRTLAARYPVAIVSNKVHSAVQELRNRFFADTIDVAIGESAGIRRKPSPDSVLEAIKLLGSNKKSTIYVGDSEVDFQTAQNACLPCISVLWGFRDKEFLEHCGANIYADSPKDILDWLEQKNYQPT